MPFPFESGWVNKIRNIDPNRVTPDDAERLQSILRCFRKWGLFPESSRGGIRTNDENREIYFYFLQDQPGAAYQETYIGFLAPTFYEERHGEAARMQGRSEQSITSRELYPMELVLNIKRECEFRPDAVDDLNQYDGGTYRRAYIPGASQDGFGKVWIVEFEETWNCKEVWFEKTEAIRRCIPPPRR